MGLLQTIKRGAKRLKDQIDPFDGGKTWQNPTPQAQPQARPQVNPYSRTQYNQAVGGLSVAPVRNPALDIKPIPTAPMPDLTVTTAKTPDFSIGNTQIKPSLNARTAPAPQQGTNIVKEFAKQVGNTGQFAASNVALAGANIAQDKQLADIYRTQRDKAFQNSLVPDIAQTANRINELSPQSRAINANLDARTEQARANADMATTNKVREINAGIKSGIYDPTKAKQVTQDLLKQQEMINQAAGARNQQRLSSAGFDMNTSKVNMGLQTAGDAANTLGYAVAPLSGKALAQMGANQAIKKKVVDVGANMALNSGGAGLATYGQTGDLKKSLEAAGIATAATGLLMGGGAVAGLKQAGRMRGVNPTKLENAGPTTYSQFSATAQPSPARLTPLGESGGIRLPFAPKGNLSYSSGNGITKVSGKRDQVIQKLNESGNLNGNNNEPTIKNPLTGETVPNPNYQPKNNLDLDIDKYKQRTPEVVETPPADITAQVANLTDEQMVGQMVDNLGISRPVATRLVAESNKPALFNNLYGSKNLIRNADSPDAYATKVMSEANNRGQAAARQNMPSTTTSVGKPPLRQVGLETPKGTPDPEIPGLMHYDTPNPSLDRVNDLYGTSLQRQIESSPVARLMMEAGDPVRRAELARLLEEGRARELPPEEAIVKQPLPTNTRSGVVDQTPLPKSKPIDLDNPSTFDKRLTKAIDDATNAMKVIDDEISASGINPDDLRAKMTAANRKEYQLTPDELIAADKMSARLNQARGILEESGVKFDGEQMFYTPQVKKGTLRLPETRDDLFNFGYSKSRGDKLGLEEIDYTKNPLVDYIVKAENRGLLIQKSIDDAAKIDGRIVPEENVVQAASKVEELQQKVQNKSKSKAVLTNDTVADLQEIGRLEGYVKTLVSYKPGRIVQSPKAMLEKAGIYKRGFEQFENAAGYGSQFKELVESQGLRGEQLYRTLEREIRTAFPDVEQSSIQSAIGQARRTMERDLLAPADAAFVYQNAFRNVAKSELFRLGKTTEFANSKMQKVVNEQINYRLMQDAYKNGFLGSFDNFITERINVSLRGLNVVSALFETGDYANIWSKYGVKDVVDARGGINSLEYSAKYGQDAPHFQSPDLNEINKWDKIWADPNTNVGKKIWESYRTAENKILFFRYIELHKTEMFFRAAEDYYKNTKGLTGTKLTNAVMEDYYNTMLPHKMLTANRILGKMPKATTQYVNWSLQATKRLGRTVAGADEGGKFSNMDRSSRIARGVSTEIVPKVAVAAMLGVPIQQVLGMRDFTGATTGDFTGISQEDKNTLDNIIEFMSVSPTISMASAYYFADRRNDIADKRKLAGETYRADRRPEDTPMSVTRKNAQNLVMFKTQANKTEDVIDAVRQGYYANKDGRVQAEAPKGAQAILDGITGKTSSPIFRDYQDNPDFRSVYKDIAGTKGGAMEKGKKAKESLTGLITKNQSVSNLVQTLGNEPTNRYKRPLTDEYSDAYKKADKNAEADLRKDLLSGGRNFNQKLDDLKRFDRPRYDKYIASMDGDNVSPEFWKKIIEGDAKNNSDLKVVHIMRDRKLQQEKDMNAAGKNKDGKFDVPPMYKLGDEQLRQVLKEKSTPTGEDLALKNILYKEQWYKDYKDAETAFFKNRPKESEEFKSTARVKEWEGFNDQYLALTGIKGDTLKKDYPLVWQLKQYEYGSDQGKQFLKNNYDAWKAQSDAVDTQKLAVINEMRRIEKQKPMTADQYAQATAIEKTAVEKAKEQADKDAKYASYGSRGGKGGREDKLSASEIFNPYSKIKVGALNKKVSSSNIKRVALKSKVKKPSIRKTA